MPSGRARFTIKKRRDGKTERLHVRISIKRVGATEIGCDIMNCFLDNALLAFHSTTFSYSQAEVSMRKLVRHCLTVMAIVDSRYRFCVIAFL